METPPLECDLVMKGGITSGVIYPLAVCELAKDYRLRSIGGSSAGAIAAAAAAAAELGRATGGFDRLAALPQQLTEAVPGKGSRLFTLFQPYAGSRGLFGVLIAALGRKGGALLGSVARAALTAYAGRAFAGALPGLLLLVLGFVLGGAASWVNLVAALLVLLVGAVIGVLSGIVRDAGKLPDDDFGLCSGMDTPGYGGPALTPWLHQTFQSIAGRTEHDPPLTFGDLEAAGIDLQVMTTNLSRRQPLAMPWGDSDYYFDPTEFRRLFPTEVVAHMERTCAVGPPERQTAEAWLTALDRTQALPLLRFPETADLPIIVAVRMSLSFPGLISAVPLHCADFSLEVNKAHRSAAQKWRREHPGATPAEGATAVPPPHLQANWFSDGGICANLPLQFFDSPLPTRPTFAVDLATFPADRTKATDEFDNSYLPNNNSAGLLRRQSVWAPRGLGALAAFGSSILNTSRGWVDEAQLSMPGYRDRIVTIYHDAGEGGINLDMDQKTVAALSERGRGGAERLSDRFAGSQPGVKPAAGWDNHRWVRFRVATASLDTWLKGFGDKYAVAHPGTTPYATWVGSDAPDAPLPALPSYDVTKGRREAIRTRVTGLLATIDDWRLAPADAFTHDAPEPQPVLKIVPPQGGPVRPTAPPPVATVPPTPSG